MAIEVMREGRSLIVVSIYAPTSKHEREAFSGNGYSQDLSGGMVCYVVILIGGMKRELSCGVNVQMN